LKVLLKERSLLEELSRIEPDSPAWPAKLGLVLIDVARQQRVLKRPEGSIKLTQKGLSLLERAGRRPGAKAFQLQEFVTGLITAEPVRLREPALALQYAERMVEMSGHRNPEFLLTLSEAYRSAGRAAQAVSAAREALAILPRETSATVPCRVRKLLQAEIRGRSDRT
jgi:tetratricopeptide (TPR) repeat protein